MGGEIGMKVGYLLGMLEGVAKATAKVEGENGTRMKKMWEDAQEELKMERMLGEEYFGSDGIWKYEVLGQDVEGEESVTFGDFARWHPRVQKWREAVEGLAKQFHVSLEADG